MNKWIHFANRQLPDEGDFVELLWSNGTRTKEHYHFGMYERSLKQEVYLIAWRNING